jgi:hypothetical protein
VLSCLHSQHERIELMALRAFVFVMANTILPYLAVMLQQHDGAPPDCSIPERSILQIEQPLEGVDQAVRRARAALTSQ